jgi:hypothetical protein
MTEALAPEETPVHRHLPAATSPLAPGTRMPRSSTATATIAPYGFLQPFDTLLVAQGFILGSLGATNQTFEQIKSFILTQPSKGLFNIGCGECVLSHCSFSCETIDPSSLADVIPLVSIKLDGLSRDQC